MRQRCSLRRGRRTSGDDSNAQGNAMFKIGAYYHGADQNIDKVLFFTFGSQKIEFYARLFHSR